MVPQVAVISGQRKSDPVSRRMFVVGGLIIGLVLAGVIGAVVWIGVHLGDVQRDGIKRNASAIERLDRVTNDLRRILHPTKAEYKAQLRSGFRRCAAEPQCREILRRLLLPTPTPARPQARSGASNANPGSSTGKNVPARLRQRGTAPHRVPARPRTPSPRPAPGSPPEPSNPAPSPSITLPVPVSICTLLLRVNCP